MRLERYQMIIRGGFGFRNFGHRSVNWSHFALGKLERCSVFLLILLGLFIGFHPFSLFLSKQSGFIE